MKTATIYLAMACVAVAVSGQYTTKYDNINLDMILSNQRLLRGYVNCLLGKQRCSKEGEELKSVLPDALQTNCSKCNQRQEAGARKVILHLIKNHRDWWNELEAVYDPSGSYIRRYRSELKKQGITV